MFVTDNMNMNTGGGSVLFPFEEAVDGGGYRPEEHGRRMFLVGGPWGPLYPLGMFSANLYEEEEDPNP